jgi:O-antigen/teichoic acid export membrane protein
LEAKDYQSIRKITKITIPLISVIALAVCLVGPEVVLVLGGSNYAAAVYMMPPMIFGCVVRYVYTLYVNIEFYNKKTGGISAGTATVAVVNIGLTFLLISKFGYMAAAYITMFSEILLLAIHMFIVKRQGMWGIFDNKQNILLLAAAGVLCMSILLLYPLPIIRYGVIALAVSAVVIVAVKFRKEIIDLLKNFKERK